MKYQIHHQTHYTYSKPVFLEPHIVRLKPPSNGSQQRVDYTLDVIPSPAGMSEGDDPSGNDFTKIWFDEFHETLELSTSVMAETSRNNPFDYLPEPYASIIPIQFEHDELDHLNPFLKRPVTSDLDPVEALAERLAIKVEHETLIFLDVLNRHLYDTTKVIVREEGAPHPPSKTLESREGACRDLTVLFIDACRSLGIPARYVSGYQERDSNQTLRYLHAWAEVYIPGGGWRGYDPTQGLVVADRHITLTATPEPAETLPVQGTFRGTQATSHMVASTQLICIS